MIQQMTDTSLPPAYLFKKEPIVIPMSDPWANDKLGRKEIAAQLSKILISVRQPMVMSLSARYGMGKSTFIDCWRQQLKNENIRSIKFNAWETDFSGDAFSAFISAFQNEFKADVEVKNKLKFFSKNVGLSLLKSTPNLLAKIAVKKATGESIDAFLESMETNDDELSEVFGDAVSAMFEGHAEATKAIGEFRNNFEEFIAEECNGRLVVFIDELDRCKPKYAVEVLESIKHLFSVKGAVFILGIDRSQLLNSISGVYGIKLDSEGYIRKFIDWDFKLPEPSYDKFINFLHSDIFDFESLYKFNTGTHFLRGKDSFITVFSEVAAAFKIPLREIEQICTQLFLILNDGGAEDYDILPIICVLLLRHIYPDEYTEIINENLTNIYSSGKVQKFVERVYRNVEEEKQNGRNSKVAAFLILRACSIQSDDSAKARVPVSPELVSKISEQAFGDKSTKRFMSYIVSEKFWSANEHSDIQNALRITAKLPSV